MRPCPALFFSSGIFLLLQAMWSCWFLPFPLNAVVLLVRESLLRPSPGYYPGLSRRGRALGISAGAVKELVELLLLPGLAGAGSHLFTCLHPHGWAWQGLVSSFSWRMLAASQHQPSQYHGCSSPRTSPLYGSASTRASPRQSRYHLQRWFQETGRGREGLSLAKTNMAPLAASPSSAPSPGCEGLGHPEEPTSVNGSVCLVTGLDVRPQESQLHHTAPSLPAPQDRLLHMAKLGELVPC